MSGPEKSFPVPVALSTAVMMVTAVISAIVLFMWHFMAQANDLKLEQQNVRGFADQVAVRVQENTMGLDNLARQVSINTGKMDVLVKEIDSLQSSILLLVCQGDPELEICTSKAESR